MCVHGGREADAVQTLLQGWPGIEVAERKFGPHVGQGRRKFDGQAHSGM